MNHQAVAEAIVAVAQKTPMVAVASDRQASDLGVKCWVFCASRPRRRVRAGRRLVVFEAAGTLPLARRSVGSLLVVDPDLNGPADDVLLREWARCLKQTGRLLIVTGLSRMPWRHGPSAQQLTSLLLNVGFARISQQQTGPMLLTSAAPPPYPQLCW